MKRLSTFLLEANADRNTKIDKKPLDVSPLRDRVQKNRQNLVKRVAIAGDIGKPDIVKQTMGGSKPELKDTGSVLKNMQQLTAKGIGSVYDDGVSRKPVKPTGRDVKDLEQRSDETVPDTKQDIKPDKERDGDHYVDRALNITRPDAMMGQKRAATKTGPYSADTQGNKDKKEFLKKLNKARKTGDYGETPVTKAQKEILKNRNLKVGELEKYQASTESQPEKDTRSAKERMSQAWDAQSGTGALVGSQQADQEMDKMVTKSQQASARPTLKYTAGGKELETKDKPYGRHSFQASGGDGFSKDLEFDDLDAIMSGTRRPEEDKLTPDGTKVSPLNKRDTNAENPYNKRTSARDDEAFSDKAREIGAGKGKRKYLTPEVQKQEKEFQDAIKNDDIEKAQKMIFKHNVSDEVLDKYMEKLELDKASNYQSLGIRGLGDGRGDRAWGGDLSKFDIPDKYKVKDGPGDQYNYEAMSKDPRMKGAVAQMQKNRMREFAKMHLRQGGRDAYASHEGLRSMADMDLEHLKPLAKGGEDHPSNWAWASSQLNQLKQDDNLVDRVDQGLSGKTSQNIDYKPGTFDSFLNKSLEGTKGKAKTQMKGELKQKWNDTFPELDGAVPKIGVTGGISMDKYKEFDDKQIKDFRKRAEKMGMSADEAKATFPDVTTNIEQPGYLHGRKTKEQARVDMERDRMMFDDAVNQISSNTGLKGNALLRSQTYKDMKDEYDELTRTSRRTELKKTEQQPQKPISDDDI